MRAVLLCLCLLFISNASYAHPGIGIVMDSQGNVFYTDLEHVWKITPNGQRTIAVHDVHTHELYIDAADNLYGEHEWYEGEATDKWGNYVWCLKNDGTFEKTIPDVEGFLDDNTLVRDPKGNSYWAKKVKDHEVLMVSDTEGWQRKKSDHNFKDIRWMHYSTHLDQLIVVDMLSVKGVSKDGKVRTIARDLKADAPPFGGVADRHYIFGTWTDKAGNIYVALYGAQKVVRIDGRGNSTTIHTSTKGWSPCGGMVDDRGNLWVMEFSFRNKTRVRKIDPKGNNTLYSG